MNSLEEGTRIDPLGRAPSLTGPLIMDASATAIGIPGEVLSDLQPTAPWFRSVSGEGQGL